MSAWDFTPTFDNPVLTDWSSHTVPAPSAPAPAQYTDSPGTYGTFDNPQMTDWGQQPAPWGGAGTPGIYDPNVDGAPSSGAPASSAAPSPAPSPAPSSAAGDGQPTADQLNAKGIIDQYLQQYGLGELDDWAWQQIVNGTTDPNQITLQLYDPTSVPGKVVDRIYPEIQMRAKAGLPPISIGDAVNYRSSAIQLMRAAGLPQDFYDQPDDLAKFIGNDVSLTELKSRIDQGVQAATNAPEQDRAELQRLYGVDTGHLAAYYLDPDKALPAIQKQWQAAQISASGVRSGYGGLSQSEAEQLASQGITADQAQKGFGQLAGMSQLFNPLPGEAGQGIDRSTGLAAEFGDNAAAQQAIERQRQARLAVFGAGGSYASGKTGLVGLGTSNAV